MGEQEREGQLWGEVEHVILCVCVFVCARERVGVYA